MFHFIIEAGPEDDVPLTSGRLRILRESEWLTEGPTLGGIQQLVAR